MSERVEIRRAHDDDYAVLRSIRLEALLDEPDAFGTTYAEGLATREEQWRQMADSWNYYLALDGSRAVGMASGGRYVPMPDARWLYGMYVTPGHRGTGVAHELVMVVAQWARREGVATLGLHVTASVTRARAFYEKLGFAVVGAGEPMRRDPSLQLLTMLTDLKTNALI